jgi:hypothetical protein
VIDLVPARANPLPHGLRLVGRRLRAVLVGALDQHLLLASGTIKPILAQMNHFNSWSKIWRSEKSACRLSVARPSGVRNQAAGKVFNAERLKRLEEIFRSVCTDFEVD